MDSDLGGFSRLKDFVIPCGSLWIPEPMFTHTCAHSHTHTQIPCTPSTARALQAGSKLLPNSPSSCCCLQRWAIWNDQPPGPAGSCCVPPTAKRSQGCRDGVGSYVVTPLQKATLGIRTRNPNPGVVTALSTPGMQHRCPRSPGLSLHPWGHHPSHQHPPHTTARCHRQIQPKQGKSHWINPVSEDFPL